MGNSVPMLTLRHTGLSSPAYRDWEDYVIVEDGRDVGRLYEDRSSRNYPGVLVSCLWACHLRASRSNNSDWA